MSTPPTTAEGPHVESLTNYEAIGFIDDAYRCSEDRHAHAVSRGKAAKWRKQTVDIRVKTE